MCKSETFSNKKHISTNTCGKAWKEEKRVRFSDFSDNASGSPTVIFVLLPCLSVSHAVWRTKSLSAHMRNICLPETEWGLQKICQEGTCKISKNKKDPEKEKGTVAIVVPSFSFLLVHLQSTCKCCTKHTACLTFPQ